MIEILKNYAQSRLDLLKMEATEKASLSAGAIVFGVSLAVFALFFLVLLNIGLAILIGQCLENIVYGFLIMAGIYLLFVILFLVFRTSVKEGIANIVIKSLNK